MLPKGKRISGLARGLWLGRDWITGGEERKRDKEKEMWMTLVLGLNPLPRSFISVLVGKFIILDNQVKQIKVR